MFHARRTYALSPVKGYDIPFSFPIYRDPDLGLLTKNIQASHDQKIVMRSWGLLEGGRYYGENFMFKEYSRTSNMLTAIWIYLLMSAMQLLPYITPVRYVYNPIMYSGSLITFCRWLVRKMSKPPGEGPILE